MALAKADSQNDRIAGWQSLNGFVIRPVALPFPGSSVVEQPAVNRLVAGSNPARGAILSAATARQVRFPSERRVPAMSSPVSPLLTDLYELNMVQAYLDQGEDKEAVFEFFVRRLPERRGFLLAAGLETALDY